MDSWYASLTARVLDLVGDYAGRELFLLEGDSLVLHCLDDSRLDFQGIQKTCIEFSVATTNSICLDGFQLLHAVRNVEEFLSHLIRSKCRFHIVFFTGISACSLSSLQYAGLLKFYIFPPQKTGTLSQMQRQSKNFDPNTSWREKSFCSI